MDMSKKWEIITPESVCVSPLKEKLVTNEAGWTRWERPTAQSPATGCVVLDYLLELLAQDPSRSLEVMATRMGLQAADLNGVIRAMSGLNGRDFLTRYQLARGKELLACTNLTVKEIATICGFKTANCFTTVFQHYHHLAPLHYRQSNRPENYRELYRW